MTFLDHDNHDCQFSLIKGFALKIIFERDISFPLTNKIKFIS